MRNLTIRTLSAVLIGFVGAAMTPANAAPLGNPATAVHHATDPADTALEKVGWRYGYRGYGWRGWYGGYYPYRYYYGGYYPRYRYYGYGYYPRYRYYGYGYYPRYGTAIIATGGVGSALQGVPFREGGTIEPNRQIGTAAQLAVPPFLFRGLQRFCIERATLVKAT